MNIKKYISLILIVNIITLNLFVMSANANNENEFEDLVKIKGDKYSPFYMKIHNNKYAIVDNSYKAYTDYIYDDIEAGYYNKYPQYFERKGEYHHNYIVKKDGKKGVIAYWNNTFVNIVNPEYDELDYHVLHNNSEYGNFGLKFDLSYKPIFGQENYLMKATKQNTKYVLYVHYDKKPNLITITIPNGVEQFLFTSNGIIYLQNNKFGFIDNNNKILLEPIYDLIYNPTFKETTNYLFVKKEDKHAIYDIKKQKLSDFIYDDIYLTEKSTISAEHGKETKTYNKFKGNLRNTYAKTTAVVHTAGLGVLTGIAYISYVGRLVAPYFWADAWTPLIKMPQEEHSKSYF